MDVRTILLSVEEREKWRRRLDVLKSTLADVKLRRHQLEKRLKALKREMSHLGEVAEATIDPVRLRPVNPTHGAEEARIPHR